MVTQRTNYILPEKISKERIGLLNSKGIDSDIAQLDLEMIKMKIQNNDDGIKWTLEQCEDAEIA
jgi:hypothetical protein